MNRLLNRRSHSKPTRLPENLSPPRRAAVERVEDAALLAVRGGFADDMGERPGTAHAAVLRSPHAHAEIVSLDATAALSMPEVVTVLTGEDVAAWSSPFIAGVKQPMRHYALAVDRVCCAGEPVAVVVARDRYAAEDPLDRVEPGAAAWSLGSDHLPRAFVAMRSAIIGPAAQPTASKRRFPRSSRRPRHRGSITVVAPASSMTAGPSNSTSTGRRPRS